MIYTETEKKNLIRYGRCLLNIFGSVQTTRCFGQTRWAMFGWPSVWSRSMWIPAGELSRQKIYAVSAWRV